MAPVNFFSGRGFLRESPFRSLSEIRTVIKNLDASGAKGMQKQHALHLIREKLIAADK